MLVAYKLNPFRFSRYGALHFALFVDNEWFQFFFFLFFLNSFAEM